MEREGWGYNDCVARRASEGETGDDAYYTSYLRIWSGYGTADIWVVQMVVDGLFWMVKANGRYNHEPKLFGPYATADDALTAAEMMMAMGYKPG